MEAEPEVLAASVESTSEKKVWPELALRGRRGEPTASPQCPRAFLGISGPSAWHPSSQPSPFAPSCPTPQRQVRLLPFSAWPSDQSRDLSPNASGGLTPLSPPSELPEIPVATREQSGLLCFHSR